MTKEKFIKRNSVWHGVSVFPAVPFYTHGCWKAPANYPVPATIAEVVIVKDTVAIYHTNRNSKVLEKIWFK